MKTKLFTCFLILGLFITSISFPQNIEKADTLDLLLKNAKTMNKDLFLVFGWVLTPLTNGTTYQDILIPPF